MYMGDEMGTTANKNNNLSPTKTYTDINGTDIVYLTEPRLDRNRSRLFYVAHFRARLVGTLHYTRTSA